MDNQNFQKQGMIYRDTTGLISEIKKLGTIIPVDVVADKKEISYVEKSLICDNYIIRFKTEIEYKKIKEDFAITGQTFQALSISPRATYMTVFDLDILELIELKKLLSQRIIYDIKA